MKAQIPFIIGIAGGSASGKVTDRHYDKYFFTEIDIFIVFAMSQFAAFINDKLHFLLKAF